MAKVNASEAIGQHRSSLVFSTFAACFTEGIAAICIQTPFSRVPLKLQLLPIRAFKASSMAVIFERCRANEMRQPRISEGVFHDDPIRHA